MLPVHARHRDDVFKFVDFVGGKGIADAPASDFGIFMPGNKTVVTLKISKPIEQTRGEAFATDWLAFFLKQRDYTMAFDTSPITGFAREVLVYRSTT